MRRATCGRWWKRSASMLRTPRSWSSTTIRPTGRGGSPTSCAASLPNIHVIHRPGKLGLGTATLAAMRFAIEHRFDYLLNLDADFSHDPRVHPRPAGGDGRSRRDDRLAVRARRRGRGGFHAQATLMSSGINGYARLMLGLTSRDNSGAFRCYRVSKLAEIDLDQVRSRGYSFQEEILFWCQAGRLPVRRDADRLQGPPGRRVQDQQARGRLGAVDPPPARRGATDGPEVRPNPAEEIARGGPHPRRAGEPPRAGCMTGGFDRPTSVPSRVVAQAISRSRTVT